MTDHKETVDTFLQDLGIVTNPQLLEELQTARQKWREEQKAANESAINTVVEQHEANLLRSTNNNVVLNTEIPEDVDAELHGVTQSEMKYRQKLDSYLGYSDSLLSLLGTASSWGYDIKGFDLKNPDTQAELRRIGKFSVEIGVQMLLSPILVLVWVGFCIISIPFPFNMTQILLPILNTCLLFLSYLRLYLHYFSFLHFSFLIRIIQYISNKWNLFKEQYIHPYTKPYETYTSYFDLSQWRDLVIHRLPLDQSLLTCSRMLPYLFYLTLMNWDLCSHTYNTDENSVIASTFWLHQPIIYLIFQMFPHWFLSFASCLQVLIWMRHLGYLSLPLCSLIITLVIPSWFFGLDIILGTRRHQGKINLAPYLYIVLPFCVSAYLGSLINWSPSNLDRAGHWFAIIIFIQSGWNFLMASSVLSNIDISTETKQADHLKILFVISTFFIALSHPVLLFLHFLFSCFLLRSVIGNLINFRERVSF